MPLEAPVTSERTADLCHDKYRSPLDIRSGIIDFIFFPWDGAFRVELRQTAVALSPIAAWPIGSSDRRVEKIALFKRWHVCDVHTSNTSSALSL